MYPTIYHAFRDLFGVEIELPKLINTFGLFVALAFIAAAGCLSRELARKHAQGIIHATTVRVRQARQTVGEAIASGIWVFIVGFKLFGIALGKYPLQEGEDAQRYILSLNGHFWAGVACAVAWTAFKVRRAQIAPPTVETADQMTEVELLPQDHTMGITGAAALGGLVGAKIFSFLERPQSIIELFEHPSLGALFSGLTIYGGLIIGALSVWIYSRRNQLPFASVCDANAPGLMLAYGMGRLGCHFAGDGDWGIAGSAPKPAWLPSWLWTFDYPNNVIRAGTAMSEGGYPGYGTHLVPSVFPTPLYEAAAGIAFFLLLWLLRKRIERPLTLFGIYLMLNGFERFWIEKIRVNATYDLWGWNVTQAEIISVLMFLGGVGLVSAVWSRQRPVPVPAASK